MSNPSPTSMTIAKAPAPSTSSTPTPHPAPQRDSKAELRGLPLADQDKVLEPAAPDPEREAFRAELQVASRQYDTTWMSALPGPVLQDIEREYSLAATATLGAKAKAALAKKVEAQLRATPEFAALDKKAQRQAIGQAFEALVREQQIANAVRAAIEIVPDKSTTGKDGQGRARESLVRVPPGGVTRIEGALLSRLDFMGTMVGVFGSEAAVKDHFTAIKPTNAPGGPWLHAGPRADLERAASTFEKRHPGYRFAATGVAFQLRNRHHEVNSAGMLGHVLGIALDYQAYDNPHLKDAQRRTLIEVMGGGPSRLVFTDGKGKELDYAKRRAIIQRMGAESQRGGADMPLAARSPESQAMLDELDGAYTAMVRTSESLRASLGSEVADVGGDPVAVLRAAGERYWAGRKGINAARGQVDRADKAVGVARKKARATLERARAKEAKQNKVAPLPVNDAEVDANPTVAHALLARAEATQRYEALTGELVATMKLVLKPWREKLQRSVAEGVAALGGVDASALALPAIQEAYKAIRKCGNNDKRLRAALVHPKLAPLFVGFDAADLTGAGLAQAALARLNTMAGVAIHEDLLGKLEGDLDFVFGAREKTVKDPAVLQLVERGFLRDDPMEPPPETSATGDDEAPDRSSAKSGKAEKGDDKPVFNREFVRAMMEHGFEPAAAWATADSMHFDHVASFGVFAGKQGKVFGAKGMRDAG